MNKEEYLIGVKAKDAVIKDVVKVGLDTTVDELKEIMLFKSKEEVLVTDGGNIVGIITKNDLARKIAGGIKPRTRISRLMTTDVFKVHPESNIQEVRQELAERDISRAPVIDDDKKVVGMLTVNSTCDCFSKRLEDAVRFLQTVFDAINEAVLVLDDKGRIKYWNNTATEVLRDSMLLDNHVKEYLPEEIIEIILNAERPTSKLFFHDKADKYYILSVRSTGSLKNFNGIIVNFKDVTQLFELKHKLDSTNGKLMYIEDQYERIIHDSSSFGELIYISKTVEDIAVLAEKVSKTDATVLITGESGTGKELLANAIHQNSLRADKPFIKINCSTIPHNLAESELFGFEKGSFTGAIGKKKGIFEAADQGTIFLDEITEMPLDMQAKLLRVLQEKTFFKVGAIRPQEVDVRVIAATNRELEELIAKGLFREDLFYRLNVIKINIPPLRERKEDIPYLISEYLNYYKKKYSRCVDSIQPEVINILENYHYPGNVRELRNIMERMTILAEDGEITVSLLPTYIQQNQGAPGKGREIFKVSVVENEKLQISNALRQAKYNKTKAAASLNVSRGTLYNKMKKYNLT